MRSPARAVVGLVLCAVGLFLWVWLQPEGDETTETLQVRVAPAARVSALDARSPPAAPVQQARGQEADVRPVIRDDVSLRRAALAPDGGALPDRETLLALGAVAAEPGHDSFGSIPPVEIRLAQAREAVAGFADAVERLEGELREAREAGVRDTSGLERRLAALTRQRELARFAERANEAELQGHPL